MRVEGAGISHEALSPKHRICQRITKIKVRVWPQLSKIFFPGSFLPVLFLILPAWRTRQDIRCLAIVLTTKTNFNMKRTANAVWKGTGKEGKGTLTTQSGAFKDQPYSFRMRFQNEDGKEGTNPEELIAAAHAGCFNMALAVQLSNAGFTPDELRTEAKVFLEPVDGAPTVTNINLTLEARIPGISEEKFLELTNTAKLNCPISRLLKAADISLEATLKG